MVFGGFFVCFPDLAGMTALMDDLLKILCQNYDKFMFCGRWKPEIRYNHKTLRTAEEKKRDYVADTATNESGFKSTLQV